MYIYWLDLCKQQTLQLRKHIFNKIPALRAACEWLSLDEVAPLSSRVSLVYSTRLSGVDLSWCFIKLSLLVLTVDKVFLPTLRLHLHSNVVFMLRQKAHTWMTINYSVFSVLLHAIFFLPECCCADEGVTSPQSPVTELMQLLQHQCHFLCNVLSGWKAPTSEAHQFFITALSKNKKRCFLNDEVFPLVVWKQEGIRYITSSFSKHISWAL